MRPHRNAVVGVVLLSILFAATVPQVSNFFYSATSEGITKVQNEDRVLDSPDRSHASDSPSEAPAEGSSDDRRLGGMLSSRGPQGIEGSRSLSTPPAINSVDPSPTQPQAPVVGSQDDTPPTETPLPPASFSEGPTQVPPAPTPTQPPPPPVNSDPKHIALQAGHWKYKEAPAPLNTMTGTSGGGKTEPEITLSIANEVAKILRGWGHIVDILPTVIPLGFKADLFIAIHADGSTNPNARGFFTDRPVGSPVAGAETRLSAAIDYEYAGATGIPYVNRSTPGSRYYYGYRQVAASVPMVLIETGFLTNALDQEILIKRPEKVAEAIASGIKRYLGQ